MSASVLILCLAGAAGVVSHMEKVKAAKLNPPKSPAQRRAMREDCRRKGR